MRAMTVFPDWQELVYGVIGVVLGWLTRHFTGKGDGNG